MKISQLCSEVNGGDCKNKVSARNGFVCAAGHSKSNGVTQPTISISEMTRWSQMDLAQDTEDEALHLQLLHTGDEPVIRGLARNPSIDEDLQWKLFRTGDRGVQFNLAKNPSIGEAVQLELFHAGDYWAQQGLAENQSICEAIQLELFRTGDRSVQQALARNPSMGRELAIELAKAGQTPHGYTQNKSLAELAQPENLALLNQYPERFGAAYLNRLFLYPQEEKEESKALTLHSYLLCKKSGGERARYYKNKILERYLGDQEIALILSTEPA